MFEGLSGQPGGVSKVLGVGCIHYFLILLVLVERVAQGEVLLSLEVEMLRV